MICNEAMNLAVVEEAQSFRYLDSTIEDFQLFGIEFCGVCCDRHRSQRLPLAVLTRKGVATVVLLWTGRGVGVGGSSRLHT